MMEGTEKAQILSAAKTASKRGIPRFVRFLDPAERREAQTIAEREGCSFGAFGGYADAERQIGCFAPENGLPVPEAYPLTVLCSAVDLRFSSVTHRDLLGAYMSLGLTRNCLGDIIVTENQIILFSDSAAAPYIADNLTGAGRVSLCFREERTDKILIPQPRGTYFRAVVASLRLDAVLSAAFHLSRSSAAERIRSGDVKLDYVPCCRPDVQTAQGAILSLRGMGRAKLVSIDGMTKKDRIGITLFRPE